MERIQDLQEYLNSLRGKLWDQLTVDERDTLDSMDSKANYIKIAAFAYPALCWVLEKKYNRASFARLTGCNKFLARAPYNFFHLFNVFIAARCISLNRGFNCRESTRIFSKYDKSVLFVYHSAGIH